jgi:hypothetical protein
MKLNTGNKLSNNNQLEIDEELVWLGEERDELANGHQCNGVCRESV